MSGTSTTAPYAGQRLSRDDVLRIMAESRANPAFQEQLGVPIPTAEGSGLRFANLRSANLHSANLRSADLSSANLRSADLRFANLRSANLHSANLSFADLSFADLSFADLRSANLRSANLHSANLSSTSCLSVTGLPSGHAILAPLPTGWRLTVGCWSGTITELRELITRDEGWPEAEGDQIIARRPMLAALADMCDAWVVDNTDILGRVQETWTPEGERREPNTEN